MSSSSTDNGIGNFLSFQTNDVAIQMTMILGTMFAYIIGLIFLQTPKKQQEQKQEGGGDDKNKTVKSGENDKQGKKSSISSLVSDMLPSRTEQPSKYAYEQFVMIYTPIWISLFGAIVVFQWYEAFDEWSYMKVCCGLASPLLLQPILFPSAGCNSPDQNRPLLERYSFKANLWIAVYSFIGNYWYTHYFYSVLKAKYTMPAHRFNNVPIALYFATHFYFSTYHFFSNCLLRKIILSYDNVNMLRTMLYISVVIVFSYFTAFMETLTISSFPDYSFENRDMAYTIGSAFYGIYFLVSFPAFIEFDNEIDQYDNTTTTTKTSKKVTWWDTIVSSCGYGMIIMILLDFVRLYLDIPLVIGK